MRGVCLALAIALLLAIVPAQAQGEEGLVWNVSDMTSPDGAGSYLTTEEASGNSNAATCTGCAAGAPYKTTSAEKAPASPDGYTSIGEAGTAIVFYKSWNNAPAPATRVDVKVLADGAVVASGSLTQDILLGAVVKFTVPLTYTGGDLPAGSAISLEVTAADSRTGVYNPAAYPRSDASAVWQVQLPLVPVAAAPDTPSPLFEDLLEPHVNHTFANATSATYVFNFTANATHGVLETHVNGTGSVHAALRDPSGSLLLNGTLSNHTLEVLNVTAGTWQLSLSYQNFTGMAQILYRDGATLATDAVPEPTGPDPTPQNGTLDDQPDAQEAPGAPLLLVVGALATLALRGRRSR